MSRQRHWDYEFVAPDAFAAMDQLVEAVEAILPRCCYGAGSADLSTGHVAYYYRANKTKARVYQRRLDDLVGVKSTLTEWHLGDTND